MLLRWDSKSSLCHPAATGTGASSATARRPGLSGSPSKTARAEGYAPLSTGDAARVEARSTHIPKAQAAAGTVAQPLPGGQAETTGYQPPRNEPPNRQNQRQSPASPDTVPIGGHVPPQPGAKGAIVPRAEPGSLLAAPREGAALRALPPGYVPVPDRDTRAGTASPPAARAPVPGATADWPGAMPRVMEEAVAPAPGLIPVRPAAPAETGPLTGQARPRSAASQPATARPASERAEPVGQAPAPAPRQAEAPLDPAFGDLADWPDDNAPVGGPRLRNTINVTVAMNGGAPDAALSGMADPATREALRDALTEILRDGARRQGIAL